MDSPNLTHRTQRCTAAHKKHRAPIVTTLYRDANPFGNTTMGAIVSSSGITNDVNQRSSQHHQNCSSKLVKWQRCGCPRKSRPSFLHLESNASMLCVSSNTYTLRCDATSTRHKLTSVALSNPKSLTRGTSVVNDTENVSLPTHESQSRRRNDDQLHV